MTSLRDVLMPGRVLFVGGILILLVPLIPHGETYAMRLATQCALLAILAISWNLVGGLTGYPSFATAAFFGLGAYVGGVLQQMGLPWAIALLAAACAAALLAAPF